MLSASEEASVRDSLDALQRDTDVQLWVWYTTTTEGQGIEDFAAETADLSSLGGTDLLLVIAVDDRAYGFSSPPGFPLSDPEIEQLLSRELEPGLRDEDYAGGRHLGRGGPGRGADGDAGAGRDRRARRPRRPRALGVAEMAAEVAAASARS